MTLEQKELLLKDLCARLPYGVVIQEKCVEHDETFLPNKDVDRLVNIDTDADSLITNGGSSYYLDEIKPYLFPLSSMTEEQRKEYENTTIKDGILTVWTTITYDWFNENHFDYRGLIPKGLAIDANGKNIY